jgi:hypothetical protein
VVSGVVGAARSETIILILGFANLVADGFPWKPATTSLAAPRWTRLAGAAARPREV